MKRTDGCGFSSDIDVVWHNTSQLDKASHSTIHPALQHMSFLYSNSVIIRGG